MLGLEVLGCLEKVRELLALLSFGCARKLNLVSLLLICSSEASKEGCLPLEELLLFLSLSMSSSLTYIKPETSSLLKSSSSMPGLYERMMLVSYYRSSWLRLFQNKFFFFCVMNYTYLLNASVDYHHHYPHHQNHCCHRLCLHHHNHCYYRPHCH